MTAYTYASFHGLMDITVDDLAGDKTENLIDVALGLLNLEGARLPEKMAGTAGSKTLTVPEQEWTVVYYVTRILYIDVKNKGQSIDTQGLSVTTRDFSTNPQILQEVRYYARKLGKNPFKDVITF